MKSLFLLFVFTMGRTLSDVMGSYELYDLYDSIMDIINKNDDQQTITYSKRFDTPFSDAMMAQWYQQG